MPTGKVKFFNEEKGFGFIITDDTRQDIYVHISGLIHEIRARDRVSFELQPDRRGQIAVNVTRIV